MKIRHGFVSNSSTTSFCIYGAYIDPPEEDYEEWEDRIGSELAMYRMCEQWAVGLDPADIKDDETGAEFKQRVKDLIFKHTGENVSCSWMAEEYEC